MELKTEAICLSAEDYRDNDKLLTLLTADVGKIKAKVRSVRSPKSKLKQCAEARAFGEYILVFKNGNYTVINCSVEDSFFSCWNTINKYSASEIVLELARKATVDGVDTKAELLLVLRAMRAINYFEFYPYIVPIWFAIKLFEIIGLDYMSEKSVPQRLRSMFAIVSMCSEDALGCTDIEYQDIVLGLKYTKLLAESAFSTRIYSIGEAIKLIAM